MCPQSHGVLRSSLAVTSLDGCLCFCGWRDFISAVCSTEAVWFGQCWQRPKAGRWRSQGPLPVPAPAAAGWYGGMGEMGRLHSREPLLGILWEHAARAEAVSFKKKKKASCFCEFAVNHLLCFWIQFYMTLCQASGGKREGKKKNQKSNCIFQFDCLKCIQLSATREVSLFTLIRSYYM